jgi:hypothetical protein
MECMPGVELREAWKELDYGKKARFAVDLVDMYDQLSKLRADGCGAIYHSTRRSTDIISLATPYSSQIICSPRWKPLSSNSLRSLRVHCDHSLHDGDGLYEIGPLQDGALLQYEVFVPSPSQTPPRETKLSSSFKAYTPYIFVIHSSVHPRIPLYFVSVIVTYTIATSSSTREQARLLGSSTGNALASVLGGQTWRWMASRRPREIFIRDISKQFCR